MYITEKTFVDVFPSLPAAEVESDGLPEKLWQNRAPVILILLQSAIDIFCNSSACHIKCFSKIPCLPRKFLVEYGSVKLLLQ